MYKIASLFIFMSFLFVYAGIDADTTSLGRERVIGNMIVLMEPKIIPPKISTIFTRCGHMQFTVKTMKKEMTRYVCIIALKNDDLSKHWEQIFGRIVKGDQVFIEGELFNGFLLIKQIFTKQESFTGNFK